MKHHKQSRYFTLVEMLVVIAIIGILIGIGTAGYKITWKKIKESRTRAALEKMKVAIESFKQKNGYYPQGTSYCVTVSNVQDVQGKSSHVNSFEAMILPSSNTDKLAKVLNVTEMKENHGDIYNTHLILVDAYPCVFSGKKMKGRPIVYVTPGVKRPGSYDLYSAGPDGDPGSYSGTATDATKDNIWPE